MFHLIVPSSSLQSEPTICWSTLCYRCAVFFYCFLVVLLAQACLRDRGCREGRPGIQHLRFFILNTVCSIAQVLRQSLVLWPFHSPFFCSLGSFLFLSFSLPHCLSRLHLRCDLSILCLRDVHLGLLDSRRTVSVRGVLGHRLLHSRHLHISLYACVERECKCGLSSSRSIVTSDASPVAGPTFFNATSTEMFACSISNVVSFILIWASRASCLLFPQLFLPVRIQKFRNLDCFFLSLSLCRSVALYLSLSRSLGVSRSR